MNEIMIKYSSESIWNSGISKRLVSEIDIVNLDNIDTSNVNYIINDISLKQDKTVLCWLNGDVEYGFWNGWDTSSERYIKLTIAFKHGKLPEDCSCLFENFRRAKTITFKDIDSSCVTDMSDMFSNCRELVSVNINTLDTSNVVYMIGMFRNCYSLTELDLKGLNTTKVTDMSCMFCHCRNLRKIDLSCLDTSKVTDMPAMFNKCVSLESIILPANMSSVINMERMFMECCELKGIDFSGVDITSVCDMDETFKCCTKLESITLDLNPKNHVSIDSILVGCENCTSINIKGISITDIISRYIKANIHGNININYKESHQDISITY